jgi:UDP-N-acetylglucosamine 2-epimerase (non-hydrolysing)
MGPVIWQLQIHPKHFRSVVVVSGQHRQMLDQVLTLFKIEPDYDLNIMTQNQTLFEVTTRALLGLQPVLSEVKPDIVLVQGDTTTSFVGALAAYYAQIPVGHIEAGLRTFDKYQPFPEEINRSLISVIADLHFAPTEQARHNLLQAGVPAERIYVTGNPVIDALLGQVRKDYIFEQPVLQQLDFENRKVILVTAHRRENFGQPMRNICRALIDIVEAEPDVEIVFTVHHNPNARGEVEKVLHGVERIHLLEPLDYLPFVQLMSRSTLILTDSGGVQEEAPSLGVPVLVLRNVTERGEGVKAGTLRLVGTDPTRITEVTLRLLHDPAEYQQMAQTVNPYGSGQAAQQIVAILKDYLSEASL